MTVRLDDIASVHWQMELGALGGVVTDLDDVDQCLLIILTTPRESVPHRPEFGSDLHRFLDMPVTVARPHVIREVIESLARWEPRVNVSGVTVEPGLAQYGELVVTVTRSWAGSTEVGDVEVRII